MSELKDAGVMLRMIYQAIVKEGLNVSLLMSKLGISPEYLQSKQLRTPHDSQTLFWQAVEEISGDQDIGLHLGQQLSVFRGQVLEYLFLSSSSFGEGLRRALNYQRLISDASNAELVTTADESYMVINTASEEVRQLRHFNECFSQGLIAFFKFVTDDAFVPLRIDFVHAEPVNSKEVAQVMGCEVRFGCDENRLYFSRDILDRASQHAEPELMALHEQLASEQVARLEKMDIVDQVMRIIAELLESGDITLETVAEKLQIKPRSLRTRLGEAETNFNQLLSDYRYRLAKRLLAGTNESIDEIVYLTGFSEPSTFYRAFKRWSNMTPIEYRKNKQGQ
jgi:AraC-like DNA-binding protein